MKTFWKASGFGGFQVGGYPLKKLLVAALIINLMVGTTSFLIQPFLPPQIPLYYGMAEAGGVIAPAWALVIPSLVSLGILGANFLLGLAITDEFLKKILVLSGLAASFFATIAILKISFLIGSL